MNKFENVDVLAALEQIMCQNTAFYQDDFEIDKEMIRKAAASDKAEDKTLLWMSRPSGTYCFRERDVFLKDTRQYNTWKFYGEQTRDHVLAYAVELTGKVGGKIRGTLYELDYQQHFRHVIAEAVKADNLILHYEKGDKEQPAAQYFNGSPDPKLGAFLRYEAKPNEPENLREVLRQEQRSREPLAPGDFKSHVAVLRNELIMREARRIVAGLKELSAPNSPNKTHFMVELSPYFVQIASSKDTDRLFSMLPYKSLCFTGMRDRHGLYAVIHKDENREKEVRRPRASIRRQLSETKQASAPKKARPTPRKTNWRYEECISP